MSDFPRLVHDDGTGRVYLHIDDELRHVVNPEVYGRLFRAPLRADVMSRFNSLVALSDTPIGSPLDGELLRNEAGAVYLVDTAGGVRGKRHITSLDAMNKYYFRWEMPVVTAIVTDAIPDHPRGPIS